MQSINSLLLMAHILYALMKVTPLTYANIDRATIFSLTGLALPNLTPDNLNRYIAESVLLRPQYIAQASGVLSSHISVSNKISLVVSQTKPKKSSIFFIFLLYLGAYNHPQTDLDYGVTG